MRQLFFFLFLFFLFQSIYVSAQEDSLSQLNIEPLKNVKSKSDDNIKIKFTLAQNLGITFQNISKSSLDETQTLQWLSCTQARFGIEGPKYQFNTGLFLQYGQLHSKSQIPKKVQDNLILTLTPSMTLIKAFDIRLFFETSGETSIGKGEVDNSQTTFLDPLFLYQTLFIGQKVQSESESEDANFELTYGIGYAFQQTITNKFVLEENRDFVIGPNNPLSSVQDQVTLESGYSALIEMLYENHLSDKFILTSSLKSVAFTKQSIPKDLKKSRVSCLVTAGLHYWIFGIDYNLRLIYDHNLSLRRQIDQTLVFGLKLNI
jgi:hypothetical protein